MPILRDGVRMLLEGEGDMTVVGQAANGLEAVRLAADLEPDIVLMDMQIPEVDGIEACRADRTAGAQHQGADSQPTGHGGASGPRSWRPGPRVMCSSRALPTNW